ncbi:hypothetical protein ONZ43_g1207 [Nemania bipapillata]|uniref:Uncharacterized protein n=1 Tax=Nemania bipapillata TaxID=110536 RepID=A0ACC2J5N4_9PEZI|nr:hypothetical protein ONZ43_g1207 [Nemania bipapillata]
MRSTLRSRSPLESSARITTSSLRLLTDPSQRPRFFSSCRALYHKKGPKPATSNKPSNPPTNGSLAAKIHPLSHYTYAQRLAMKSQPTTLYEAASQTGFLISSYGAAFFCLGSAGINSWFNVYNLPPGISSWVPVGFGVVSFVFAALGTVFALRPSSIIRSVKVLPNPALQKAPGSPKEAVTLEITARRIAPIPLPLKRLKVAPDHVVMVNRMNHRPVVLSREQLAAKRIEDEKRRKERRQYELDHIMTAPFRDARRASSTLFDSIRRSLTGEGFAPIFINGVKYKLDIEGGYALENGQILDRIVKIQPDPRLARMQSETPAKTT